MPLALPVRLLDLSPGGFSIESSVPFMANAEYTFQFSATRQHGPIRAKVAHCVRVSDGKTSVSYATGFSFVLSLPEDKEIVDDLVAEAHDLMVLATSH